MSEELRARHPELHDVKWVLAATPDGNLLLFLLLTMAVNGFSASWLNPFPYLSTFQVPKLQYGW